MQSYLQSEMRLAILTDNEFYDFTSMLLDELRRHPPFGQKN
jgi:hypothetical protein